MPIQRPTLATATDDASALAGLPAPARQALLGDALAIDTMFG